MTRKRFVKLLMSYNYSRNEAYQTAYILVDEDVGLTMVIPSVQDAIITYKELTYTVDCFMMKFADSMCDRLLYDGIATKRHLWTVYVKGEFVAGGKE